MNLATIEYKGNGNVRAESYTSETVFATLDIVLATVREWMASEARSDGTNPLTHPIVQNDESAP